MKKWIATLLMVCLLPIAGYGIPINIHFVDQRADRTQAVILVAFNNEHVMEPILPATGVLEKNQVDAGQYYNAIFLIADMAQGFQTMGHIYFSLGWECKGPHLGYCDPQASTTAKAIGTPSTFTYTPSGQKPITVSGPSVANDGTVMFYISD